MCQQCLIRYIFCYNNFLLLSFFSVKIAWKNSKGYQVNNNGRCSTKDFSCWQTVILVYFYYTTYSIMAVDIFHSLLLSSKCVLPTLYDMISFEWFIKVVCLVYYSMYAVLVENLYHYIEEWYMRHDYLRASKK